MTGISRGRIKRAKVAAEQSKLTRTDLGRSVRRAVIFITDGGGMSFGGVGAAAVAAEAVMLERRSWRRRA